MAWILGGGHKFRNEKWECDNENKEMKTHKI